MSDLSTQSPAIPLIAFKQRASSLDIYCPFCGQHSLSESEIKTCEHLILVHMSVTSDAYTYIHGSFKDDIDTNSSLFDALDIIEQSKPFGTFVGLQEVEEPEEGELGITTTLVFDSGE